MSINKDLEKLLESLPCFINKQLNNHCNRNKIIEVVMDLGRRPEVSFTIGTEYLSQKRISWQEIEYTIKNVGKFNNKNRAGIDKTLHRISCIRNRQFLITGLTCRIGRVSLGTIGFARDLLESGKSILILGQPGIGKTTIIREIARTLSDEMEKRVIIIDTSNEIAGNNDIPHFGIGRARRLEVDNSSTQHHVMIEAVENHTPQAIIIDEIGTELEALAACTIAEKGVQLIGTAHANCLNNLINNSLLVDLVGGIQYVTLSDNQAKNRKTQKSILERKSDPAFQIIVEIKEQNLWYVHENVKESIDLILRNNFTVIQLRQFLFDGKNFIRYRSVKASTSIKHFSSSFKQSYLFVLRKNELNFDYKQAFIAPKKKRVYLHKVSCNLVREISLKLQIDISLTKEIKMATLIIGLKRSIKFNHKLYKLAKLKHIPIYVINKNSIYEITKLIKFITL